MGNPLEPWVAAVNHLSRLVGKPLHEGKYSLASVDDLAIVLARAATGSTVRISRTLVEKTSARLASGERIPHRGISFTSAIEYGVVLALGRAITDDGAFYASATAKEAVRG